MGDLKYMPIHFHLFGLSRTEAVPDTPEYRYASTVSVQLRVPYPGPVKSLPERPAPIPIILTFERRGCNNFVCEDYTPLLDYLLSWKMNQIQKLMASRKGFQGGWLEDLLGAIEKMIPDPPKDNGGKQG